MNIKVKSPLARLVKKLNKYGNWHRWFAWYPISVAVDDNTNKVIWLEIVGRKKAVTKKGRFDNQPPEYCTKEELVAHELKNERTTWRT